MCAESAVADDEVLYRRVPPGPSRIKEGRLTSGNFSVRPAETGISVSRASMTSPAQLLAVLPDDVGWQVWKTTALEIRELGLEAIPRPTTGDRGHAEIVPAAQSFSHAVRRKLARAFRPIDEYRSPG